MAGLAARACWVDTVIEIAQRLRATYLAHPAAASHLIVPHDAAPGRDAGGQYPHRRDPRGRIRRVEAVRVYRALGDFALSLVGRRGNVPGSGRAPADDRSGRVDQRVSRRGPGRVPAHLAGPHRIAGRRGQRHLRYDPVADHHWAHPAGAAAVRMRRASGRPGAGLRLTRARRARFRSALPGRRRCRACG